MVTGDTQAQDIPAPPVATADAVAVAAWIPQEFDAEAIATLLPHREPFCFLQSALLEGPREITGVALWPAGHPILSGHFPGYPVVPGVCMVEAAAQLAGVAMTCVQRGEAAAIGFNGARGMLGEIRSARFSAALKPDEPVRMRAVLRCMLPGLWTASARGVRGSWAGAIELAPRGEEVFRCELVIGVVSPT
jgi:3-hydroxyacyl-[acyl-carrier-protein] dehydratase